MSDITTDIRIVRNMAGDSNTVFGAACQAICDEIERLLGLPTWEEGYAQGEMERRALAIANSDLRSDLLKAQQALEISEYNYALLMAELD